MKRQLASMPEVKLDVLGLLTFDEELKSMQDLRNFQVSLEAIQVLL
jgi:hypothetical protein